MKIPYIISKHEILKLELETNKIYNIKINDNWFNQELSEELLYEELSELNLANLYNFIHTLRFFYDSIDFSIINEVEEKIYIELNNSTRNLLIIKNFQKTMETVFNELIKKDWTFFAHERMWLSSNLDNFYRANLNHIKLTHENIKKILPISGSKDLLLAEKIIKRNVITATIERHPKAVFFCKTKKKEYPTELLNSINFTKGYLICFPYEIGLQLKKYKYTRKTPKTKPTFIKIKNIKTFTDSLNNYNYSSPIWMKDVSINNTDCITDYSIFNDNLLNEAYSDQCLIDAINFLNSIKLKCNWNVLNYIYSCLEKNDIDPTLFTKNSIINNIYIVNQSNDLNEITNNDEIISDTVINSAAILELIKQQFKEFKEFYIEHRLCSRIRFYAYTWPLNYQLSHIVRISLSFTNNFNFEKTYNMFLKHPSIKKHLYTDKIFLHDELTSSQPTFIKFIKEEFKLDINNKDFVDKLKIEYILILLTKITPKNISDLDDKIFFSTNIFDNFITADLTTDWEFWCNKTQTKKKKVMYLLTTQKYLIDAKNNTFDGIFWGDASSNAIQLITLRLGIKNKKLLKLTNIINNDTNFENIYSYITHMIVNTDHNEFIEKKLKNKITEKELNNIQNDDLNKYMIMPSSYGMGIHSYKRKIEYLIHNNSKEIWEKLNKVEKDKITEYFWNLAHKYLKEIEFCLEDYKKICKNLWYPNNYDAFVWKNDFGITVAPVNFKTSRRDYILKEINKIKLIIKETLYDKKIKKLETKLEKLKTKLKKDEKFFWKRSMIHTLKNKIFVRIYHCKYKINKHETRQALVPNSIHTYDSSIMLMIILICKDLKIDILVIHDSIGCHPLFAPLIKLLFKIVNIIFIEKAKNQIPFPLNTSNTHTDPNLYKEILESKNFFR